MTESTPGVGVPTCYRHPARESYIRCQRCERSICPDCMNDASVGFQCPDCVAQGIKQTRTGRTAYGGVRSGNPALTSMVLIGMNVAVFVLIAASGGNESRFLDTLLLRPSGLCLVPGQGGFDFAQSMCVGGGASWLPGVSDGAYWQLITSAFTHVQVWHIGFNMLALYVLGPQIELALGRTRFLAVYFISALSGSALVMWASSEFQGTLGASGAIFGLMGALVVIALKAGGQVQPLLVWLGINAVITFTIPNVSWQGHLGGFIGGALVAAALVLAPRGPRRTPIQFAALVLVALLTLGAIAARVFALS